MLANRDCDVAIYGATGFVGRQAAHYLSARAPRDLRWTMAGRSRARLEAVRAGLPGPTYPQDLQLADSEDPESVQAFASRAKVVLNTAGPFARYGTPVVDACVRCGTHYVDIAGEIGWIHQMVSAYHDRAALDGTRIVPSCGFDSVPSDIGTLLMVHEMARVFGMPCSAVRACFQLSGGLNGGTIASALNSLDSPSIHSPRSAEQIRDLKAPRYDAGFGAWIGPFFMAPINARVVRRSAALSAACGTPYGEAFVYEEALKFDAPLGALKAAATTLGLAAFLGALQWQPTRRAIAAILPKPGEGPSEERMDRGWFTCELIGLAADGRQMRGRISYAGDPGNRATTTFVCEAALALCADADALPGGRSRGGVLTPATALGLPYATRLRAAGVDIQIPAGPVVAGQALPP